MAPSAVEMPVIIPKSFSTPTRTNGSTHAGDLKGPSSPVPEVKSFDGASCSVEELVAAIRVAGGVVIRGLLNADEIASLEKDTRPWLEQDNAWGEGGGEGEFFPKETRRAFGMVTKSRTFAERIVGHPLWKGVTDALLSSNLHWNWIGEKNEPSVSRPQLNNTIVFSIGPGARDQALHRDDAIHHVYHPAAATHEIGRDAGIGFFVAGKKTTRRNGATRFIPGSHLWDYAAGPPREEQTFYAELEPGDGFMVLSGCFHGGSANKTNQPGEDGVIREEERLVYSTFMTRGYLRQEENQYLVNPVEKVRELPENLQELVGYGLSKPFLGWVDLKDPMLWLHPERPKKSGDLF
ncbi:phytanoyl-CoA dioxygenase family protein [Cladophialophora carrionii]|uniref:Phytanoyl-CoA dioxygenase family protein n=1 Tax=Cladophialophora carrionii TaxID=86049 RepID=A0A1C1CVU0_9EURO|nr:phytanoyl-CoA dioxygenase family protein [Cladophialophora carrionii]